MPKRARPPPPPASSTAFQEQSLLLKLALPPAALQDLDAHIHAALSAQLMRHNEQAGGVLLSLSHVRLPPSRRFASILGTSLAHPPLPSI